MGVTASAFLPLGLDGAGPLAIAKGEAGTCLCIPDTLCNSSSSAPVAWPIRPPEPVGPAGHPPAADLVRI